MGSTKAQGAPRRAKKRQPQAVSPAQASLPDVPPVLSVDEFCQLAKISRTTFWRRRAAGLIKARKDGNLVRITREEFHRYINSGGAA